MIGREISGGLRIITLGDLAATVSDDRTTKAFADMVTAAQKEFRRGWASIDRTQEWLLDYAKVAEDRKWDDLACALNWFPDSASVSMSMALSTEEEP